jgi:hypothetical protein
MKALCPAASGKNGENTVTPDILRGSKAGFPGCFSGAGAKTILAWIRIWIRISQAQDLMPAPG